MSTLVWSEKKTKFEVSKNRLTMTESCLMVGTRKPMKSF